MDNSVTKRKHSKKYSTSDIGDTSDLISQLIHLESKDLNKKKKRKSRTSNLVSNAANPKKRKLDLSISSPVTPLVSVKIEKKSSSSSEDEHHFNRKIDFEGKGNKKQKEVPIPIIQPKTEPLWNSEKNFEKVKVKREKTLSPPVKEKKINVPKPIVKKESLSADDKRALPKTKNLKMESPSSVGETMTNRKNLLTVKEEKPDSGLETSKGKVLLKEGTIKCVAKNTVLHSESSEEEAASAKKVQKVMSSKVKRSSKNRNTEIRTPFKNKNKVFTSTPSMPKQSLELANGSSSDSSSETLKEPTGTGRQNGITENVHNKYLYSSFENEVSPENKSLVSNKPKPAKTLDADNSPGVIFPKSPISAAKKKSSSNQNTSSEHHRQVNQASNIGTKLAKKQERNKQKNNRIAQVPKRFKEDCSNSSSEEDTPVPIKTNSIKLIQPKANTSGESESSEDEQPSASVKSPHSGTIKTVRKHKNVSDGSKDYDASLPQSLRHNKRNKLAQNWSNTSDSKTSKDEEPAKNVQLTSKQPSEQHTRVLKETTKKKNNKVIDNSIKNTQILNPIKNESKNHSGSNSSSEEGEVTVPKPLKLEHKTSTSDEESEASEGQQNGKKTKLTNGQHTRTAKETNGEESIKKIANPTKKTQVPKPIKKDSKTLTDSNSSSEEEEVTVPKPWKLEHKTITSDEESEGQAPGEKVQLTTPHDTMAAKRIDNKQNKTILNPIKNTQVSKVFKKLSKMPSDSSSCSEEEKLTVPKPLKLEHRASTSDESENLEVQPIKKAQLTTGRHTRAAKETNVKEIIKKIARPTKKTQVPKPIKEDSKTLSYGSSSSEEEEYAAPKPFKLEDKTSTSDELGTSEEEQPVTKAQLTTPQDTQDRKKVDSKKINEKIIKPFKNTQVPKPIKTPLDTNSSSEDETNTVPKPLRLSHTNKTADNSKSSEEEKPVAVKKQNALLKEGAVIKNNKQVVIQVPKPNKLKVSRIGISPSESSTSSEEEDKQFVHQLMMLKSESSRLRPNNDSSSETSEDELPAKVKPKHDAPLLEESGNKQTTHSSKTTPANKSKKSKERQISCSSVSSGSSAEEGQFVSKSKNSTKLIHRGSTSESSENKQPLKPTVTALVKKRESKKIDIEFLNSSVHNSSGASSGNSRLIPKSVDKLQSFEEEKPDNVENVSIRDIHKKDKNVPQVPKPIKIDSEAEFVKMEIDSSSSHKQHFEEKWIQKLQTKHPNIKRKTIKIEMPDIDTGCYLLRLPKNVDPTSLLKLKCNFEEETKFKLNNENWLFKPLPKTPEPMVLSINETQLVTIKKIVVLQQDSEKKVINDIVVTKRENVPLPNALKTRHPLFGVNYKKKIKLDDTTQMKIIKAKEHLIKIEKKLKKKKHKLKNKSDFTLDEQGILDIFNASNLTTDVGESKEKASHTSKKHKRKRVEETFEDIEMQVVKEQVRSKKRKRKSEVDMDASFEKSSKKRKS